MKTKTFPLLVLFGALVVGACDSSSPTTPTATTPGPAAETMIESFAGMLVLGGSNEHNFATVAVGAADISITSLAPLSTLTVGLGVGTVADGACTLFAQDNAVRVGETLRATDLPIGTYCVRVYDVGNIFEGQTVDYALDVDHP